MKGLAYGSELYVLAALSEDVMQTVSLLDVICQNINAVALYNVISQGLRYQVKVLVEQRLRSGIERDYGRYHPTGFGAELHYAIISSLAQEIFCREQ